MTIELRPLTAADAQDYKRIRLNALKQAPTAFTSSFQSASQLGDDFFIERASSRPDSFIIGAFSNGELIGTCGGFVEPDLKRSHIANVVGMWIEPSHRSRGIARKLVVAVIAQLEKLPQVTSIQLSVTAGNSHALSLYQDIGFTVWGEEPDALKVDGTCYNELHLILDPG